MGVVVAILVAEGFAGRPEFPKLVFTVVFTVVFSEWGTVRSNFEPTVHQQSGGRGAAVDTGRHRETPGEFNRIGEIK